MTKQEAIEKLADLVAEFVAQQVAKGRSFGEAYQSAMADIEARWPNIAAAIR